MTTTTPNMSMVLPDDHGSLEVWGAIINTALGIINDQHDHTPGKGVKIPAAALNINGDVSWSSGGVSHSLTDVSAVDFTAVAAGAVTAFAGALFLSSVDGNLYWRTTLGTNVQMTNGPALNVAAFAGAIGGDYSSVGALELFDDATDSYWFQQQLGGGVRQYARMRSADVDLYEYKAQPTAGVPTNRVRLASPASLGASYTVTWPAATPGSTLIMQMSAAGVLTASNTTGALSPASLAVAGAATVGGLLSANAGLTVFGALSANGIISAGAGVDVLPGQTLSVRGLFTHTGSWVQPIHASAWVDAGGSFSDYSVVTAGSGRAYYARRLAPGGPPAKAHVPVLGLRVGDNIDNVTFDLISTTTTFPSYTISAIVIGLGGVAFAFGNKSVVGFSGTGEFTDSFVTNFTIATGQHIYLEVTYGAGASSLGIVGATVSVNHP